MHIGKDIKINRIIFLVLCGILLLTACSLNEEDNPHLKVLESSCTEVWLKVSGETGTELTLTRDNNEIEKFTLSSSPQTIRDDSLTPNTTYNYQITGNGETSTTEVTTLDTTSHDFTWQTNTFGDPNAGNSILYDIAVISENDIWAVGAIYIADTSANGFTNYSAVHWNGNEWELKKLFYNDKDYYGNDFTVILTNIRGIFVFNNTDIWLAAGSIFRWNGVDSLIDFSFRTVTPSGLQPGINKLLKYSNSELYGVGNSGSIIRYINGAWQKLESGTDLPFQDIWGSNSEILAIASDEFGFGGQYLISISGNTVNQISTDITTASAFSSIWFESNRKYFLAGNGVYTKHNLSDAEWEPDPVSQPLETYFYSIRGSSLNNIVTVGEGSYIAHFNGVTWKVYNELRNPPDRLSAVAVTENMIVAVGNKYVSGNEVYGLVYIGKR